MSLLNVFDITSSSIDAQSVRLNITASNLANADHVSGSEETAYKAGMPIFKAVMKDVNGSGIDLGGRGVEVAGIVKSKEAAQQEYRPDHPLANEHGMIFKSNVKVVHEMVDMISASRTHQVNVDVAETAKQMLMKTINMGQ